jgi:hypothetical protein
MRFPDGAVQSTLLVSPGGDGRSTALRLFDQRGLAASGHYAQFDERRGQWDTDCHRAGFLHRPSDRFDECHGDRELFHHHRAGDSDSDTNADGYSDADAYSDAYCHADTDSDAHCNSDGHSDSSSDAGGHSGSTDIDSGFDRAGFPRAIPVAG